MALIRRRLLFESGAYFEMSVKRFGTYLRGGWRSFKSCCLLEEIYQGFIQKMLMPGRQHKKPNLLIEIRNSIFYFKANLL